MRVTSTYRAVRRNAAKGLVWKGAKAKYINLGRVRLNRSRRLPTSK